MTLFKEAEGLKIYIGKQKNAGKTIGFVPTMGALHSGHISLIEQSKQKCDISVCSIFVNPTQFNDPKDFEKYPVTISNDILQLERAGVDILFLPSVNEIYPEGLSNLPHYDLGDIENLLEGKYRPGHFQGVCQVVHRLLQVVSPGYIFMGQKDYQQCIIVKKLIELTNMPVKLETGKTHREESGLAMSSRNTRLSGEQMKDATAISTILKYIKDKYQAAPLRDLEEYAKKFLLSNGFSKVDYVSIANAATLHPVESAATQVKSVALIAATIGETRLIDNMVLQD
ncbi:MAG TPA: pantoate--beta-alanine ligase [Segetibacter sp.]